MQYTTNEQIVTPDQETPGKGASTNDFSREMYQRFGYRPSSPLDLNDATVPASKGDGGNLKAIEANIQDRFSLFEQGMKEGGE